MGFYRTACLPVDCWLDGLVDRATATAYELLRNDPARLAHSNAVAHRAAELAITVQPGESTVVVAAAWLHDIGYAADARDTGFHPLDGARYLRRHGWRDDICRLVAYHSGSRFVAPYAGLQAELSEFVIVRGPLADALTAADQTVGVHGESLHYEERMRDMLHRHGGHTPTARAHGERAPYLRAVAARVAERLRRAGEDPARFGLA